MQQSSATPSLHLDFWGLRKIVACSPSSSQCLLVPTVFGTVSSLHPISFLMIFILVIIMDKCACFSTVHVCQLYMYICMYTFLCALTFTVADKVWQGTSTEARSEGV